MIDRLEIRPQRPEDHGRVRQVVAAAFGEEGGRVVRMVDALDASRNTQTSLVAKVDGVLVGHVQLSRSWVDARERLVEVLVLSPLSIRPDKQKQGIGGALVTAAISAARLSGTPAVFLEGSPKYYSRLGFVRASEHGFLRPSLRVPEPGFQVALLDRHERWMTGQLIYCEAFWATDMVGLRDPLLAKVEAQATS